MLKPLEVSLIMNFSQEMLLALLDSAVLVTLVAGLFRLFGKWYSRYLNRRKARNQYEGMSRIIELSEEIQILRTRLHFERITIEKLHNGGDILHPANGKYMSMLEDSFSNEIVGSLKKDYQHIPLDNQFAEVFHRAMSSKYYHLYTNMMCKDGTDSRIVDNNGVLYTMYQSHNIKSVYYIYLGASAHGLIWLTLQSMGVHDNLSPKQKQIIKVALPRIREYLDITEAPTNTL